MATHVSLLLLPLLLLLLLLLLPRHVLVLPLLLLLLLLLLLGILYVFHDSLLCASLSEYDSRHAHFHCHLQHFLFTESVIYSFFLFQLPVGIFRVFVAFLWSQQPEVLVFAVHLAVGTFSESLLFLDFLKTLFLYPWTNSLVFAVFRSFFQLELFLPKTRFGFLGKFTSFTTCFFLKGGWGEIITCITTSGMACCEQNHAEPESLRATSLWLLSCTGPPNSTSPT